MEMIKNNAIKTYKEPCYFCKSKAGTKLKVSFGTIPLFMQDISKYFCDDKCYKLWLKLKLEEGCQEVLT